MNLKILLTRIIIMLMGIFVLSSTSYSQTTYSVLTTQVPAASYTDGPYEMGMKFQSSQAGTITKIRFYKVSGETAGTHTGRLWSSSGTQLASVVFSGETSSGWQEATLATPYSISVNTTYVVSVNTSTSSTQYGATNNGLAPAAITNGPLSSVAVASNGVYGTTVGAFPTSSFLSSNYFRDVVFAPALVVVPVIFSTIKASQQLGGVKVEWSNQTETDVLNYAVERSADGRSFITISTVDVRLNNGDRADYTFLDAAPIVGVNYYRINAKETNGSSKYSSIVKVDTKGGKTDITIYPNLVSRSQVSFQVTGLPKGKYIIRVINASGQQVYNKLLLHNGGAVTEVLQLSATVKTGVYGIQLTGGEVSLTKKFIVQ